MFGFLNPRPQSADYRRAYARMCLHQRREYGIWALPFHSYEAVLLYQVALDCGAFPAAVMPHVRCCRLGSTAGIARHPDADVGRFAASVAMLLTSIKLDDDIQDNRSIPATVARGLLRRRIERAKRYFRLLDPRFDRNVATLLADHHRLESAGRSVPIREYVEPTAESFGYVFGLASRLPGLADRADLLRRLGRCVGSAIIAYDCAVDWRRDRRTGQFNPLADESEVAEAFEVAARALGDARDLMIDSAGGSARSAATLEAVRRRVMRRRSGIAEPVCTSPRVGLGTQILRTLRWIMTPVPAVAAGAMTAVGSRDRGGSDDQPPDRRDETYPVDDANDGADTNRSANIVPQLPGGITSEGNERKPVNRDNRAQDGCCDCCIITSDTGTCCVNFGECCSGCDGCDGCSGCDCSCN